MGYLRLVYHWTLHCINLPNYALWFVLMHVFSIMYGIVSVKQLGFLGGFLASYWILMDLINEWLICHHLSGLECCAMVQCEFLFEWTWRWPTIKNNESVFSGVNKSYGCSLCDKSTKFGMEIHTIPDLLSFQDGYNGKSVFVWIKPQY